MRWIVLAFLLLVLVSCGVLTEAQIRGVQQLVRDGVLTQEQADALLGVLRESGASLWVQHLATGLGTLAATLAAIYGWRGPSHKSGRVARAR